MGMKETIVFPNLDSSVQKSIVKAVTAGIKKAEDDVQGRRISINGMQVDVDVDTQDILSGYEKQIKNLQRRKEKGKLQKEIDKILSFDYEVTSKGRSLPSITKEQDEEIKVRVDALRGLTDEQEKEYEKQLKLEKRLINEKNRLLEKLTPQRAAAKNGTLDIKETESYYQNLIRLQKVRDGLRETQAITKSTGNLALGFDVDKLIGNLKDNGGLSELLTKAYENEIQKVQQNIDSTLVQAQQKLVSNIIKGNPLSKAVEQIQDAETQIENAYKNILGSFGDIGAEYNELTQLQGKDKKGLSNEEFNKLEKLEKKFKTLLVLSEKYNINLSEMFDSASLKETLFSGSKGEKDFNTLLKSAKDDNIEKQLRFIASQREKIKETEEYVSSMKWTEDQSVRAAYGDDVVSSLSSKIQEMREENERLKQSLATFVDKDQFDELQAKLKESTDLVAELQQKVEELNQTLAKQKEMQAGSAQLVQTTDDANVNAGLEQHGDINEVASGTAKRFRDSVTFTAFHGTKLNYDKFDFDKTKAAQMGSGLYLTADGEGASRFGKTAIKELSGTLESCFVITKDYITSIEDLYKAMGKAVPDGVDIKQAMSDMRNHNKESKENSDNFRKNMLSMGYQGMYVGDNLANKLIPEELVIYDEKKLENLKSFTNNEFKELQKQGKIEIELQNIEDVEVPNQVQKMDGIIDKSDTAKDGVVNVDASPEVVPEEFVNNLTKQLDGHSVDVNVRPSILSPESFVDDVTKQLSGYTAAVDVKPEQFQNSNTVIDSFESEGQIVQTSIGREITELGELDNALLRTAGNVDAKTNAFRQEEQVVIGTVQREVTELEILDGQLQIIRESLYKLQNLSITLDLKVSDNFDDNKTMIVDKIEELKRSLDGIDTNLIQNLSTILSSFSISNETATNFGFLVTCIGNLKKSLVGLDTVSIDFINGIKEIVDKSSSLKDLAEVLRASQKQIQNAINQGGQKSLDEINKIRKDFIQAAEKTQFDFDESSLVVDKNGIITFTQTIENAGKAAVVTKYKIDNLYATLGKGSRNSGQIALNQNGTLNKRYLNQHAEKVSTSGRQTEEQKNEIKAQKELNALVDQYIAKRKQEANTKNEASKAVYSYESIQLLDKISNKIKEVRNASLLTEDEIKKSLGKILDEEDQLANKMQIRYDIERKNELDAYDRKDQVELYNALSQAVKEYVYWLEKEKSTTGSAKGVATSLREEAEHRMNSLRGDISSYNLKDLEKELEIDKKILQARQKINYQDEVAETKAAESSYEREYKLQEKLYRLKKNNIGADSKTKAKNDVRIADVERAIQNEQQHRVSMGLSNKAIEAKNALINKTTTLMRELTVEENAYNAAVKVGDSEAATKFVKAATDVENKLKSAVSNYTDADPGKIAEAKDLIKKLRLPIANYSVDSSNVDSVIKEIEKNANEIIASIRKQHERINNETKYSGQMKDYEKLANDTFKGATYNDALFKEARFDSSGKGTLTFLELVGDRARETKIYIDDLDSAISEMQNGTFDFESHKETFNWRKATKNDIFGDDYANAENNKVQQRIDAYNGLIKTEDKYQKLRAKSDSRTITDAEIVEFEKLINQRKKYNDILGESIVLTEQEFAFYEQSGKAKLASLESKYEKQKKESSYTYSAYNTNNAMSFDDAWEEAHRFQQVIKQTDQLMSQFESKTDTIENFALVLNRAKEKIQELNAEFISGKLSQTEYSDQINEVVFDLNKVVAVTAPGDFDEAKQKMLEHAAAISKGKIESARFSNDYTKLLVVLNKGNGICQDVEVSWDRITGAITDTVKQIRPAKTLWEKFVGGVHGKLLNLGSYITTFVSFYEVINILKQGVQYIKEFDSALTEMRKVSDETVISLKKFQETSFDIAHSIGSTAKQIQDSTADFMRLGYSLEESAKFAEDANIYANVGDMETEEATEHMISSIKAWGSEFENEIEASRSIIDRYNEIGNNFAITSADIGSAMERSAAALKEGGNTLNEALGLITAGNVIQQDAETTAAALKILSLRIRGSKAELEEMGESTDGLASSSSKLREEIKALSGVDIMVNENTYKSTAQIIKDLGEVYNKLSDVSQAALLEKLAGKNRASTVAGLLENYTIIDDVIKAAEKANGSALKENQAYLDSVSGKIAQVVNKTQELWYKALSSDTVKIFLDLVINVLDKITSLVDKIGEVGVAISAIATGAGFIKFKKYFSDNGKSSGGRVKMFTLVA